MAVGKENIREVLQKGFEDWYLSEKESIKATIVSSGDSEQDMRLVVAMLFAAYTEGALNTSKLMNKSVIDILGNK